MIEDKIEKCFLDEYSDDFNEYIDRNRIMQWINKPEYKEISKKICDLKNKYPNVIAFLEDANFEVLDKQELEIVKQIIHYESELDTIEEKEIFKLGMKENYIYLESMDMIKI